MAFENVYISKTEGDALGSFNAACIITKAPSICSISLVPVVQSSELYTTTKQLPFCYVSRARKPASGGSSLQLLLLTNCPMQLLQQAACLAHWADWQQVNHKKTKQSPLKQKLLALVSKISYLHCISLYVHC